MYAAVENLGTAAVEVKGHERHMGAIVDKGVGGTGSRTEMVPVVSLMVYVDPVLYETKFGVQVHPKVKCAGI